MSLKHPKENLSVIMITSRRSHPQHKQSDGDSFEEPLVMEPFTDFLERLQASKQGGGITGTVSVCIRLMDIGRLSCGPKRST